MELSEREAIIETCQHAIQESWVEIGCQLAAIREERSYKHTHQTFAVYCQDRWGYSDRRARQLIDGAAVVEALEESGTEVPLLEKHARPLTSLAPEHRDLVWKRALETAPAGRITQRHVIQTIHEMFPPAPLEEIEEIFESHDSWDERLADVVIPALGLMEVDPDRVASWSFERRQEWRERLTNAMNALSKVLDMLDVHATPKLVHGGFSRE